MVYNIATTHCIKISPLTTYVFHRVRSTLLFLAEESFSILHRAHGATKISASTKVIMSLLLFLLFHLAHALYSQLFHSRRFIGLSTRTYSPTLTKLKPTI